MFLCVNAKIKRITPNAIIKIVGIIQRGRSINHQDQLITLKTFKIKRAINASDNNNPKFFIL
jgi:hypothetical protein